MSVRRVLIPVAFILVLLAQFVPGTVFSPRPAAAYTACDWAQFITDVTVPDGTAFAPGAAFVKTWRLKNIGTCTWTTSYAAVFYSGSQMGAPAIVNLTNSVAPGATVDISVNMTAPSAPGRYVGYWKLRNASNVLFGIGASANGIYLVDILVTASYSTAYDFVANYCSATWTSGAGSLPCPGTDGDAKGFVLNVSSPQLENGTIDTTPGLAVSPQKVAGGYIQAVYPDFTVQAGDRFQSIVNCAYNEAGCYVNFRLDYKIGSGVQKTFWSFNERYEGLYYRANIDLSSLAGQTVKFILYVADVSGRGSPTADRVLWGGARIIRPSAGGPLPTTPPSTTCDKGAFVADTTIPDGTTLAAGSSFTKTWTIKNVGTCTWTNAYSLVFTFGDLLGATSSIPLSGSVAPGATVDLSVNMVAPNAAGHYRSYWRLKNASGAQFGVGSNGMVTFFVDINVTSSSGTAYDFAGHACEAVWSSGAGALTCPGTDGDAKGFVLKLDTPKLEDGSTGAAGILTAPQNVTNGYIQGVYPAFIVQSGDRFLSIINCQFGVAGCYVTFQLNYQIGSGAIQTLKSFSEKIDGMYYNLDVNLSALAGQNVNFILKVLASGSPTGDRAVWSGPRIARLGGSTTPAAPTATLTPTGTVPTTTRTPTSGAFVPGPYGVVLVSAGNTLTVRTGPGGSNSILGTLPGTTNDAMRTGPSSTVAGEDWVQLQNPSGGWVNAYYLTEYVPSATFCADTRVNTLLTNFANALKTSNGTNLASLVSPKHGLAVRLWRNSSPVIFDQAHAQWIFESTYTHNWGTAPGSGLNTTGSFHDVVLPTYLDVVNAPAPGYTLGCNTLQVGGATYTPTWPSEYSNVNYYSLYKAGPTGNEMSWRTLLVGVEFVGGQPYIFSVTQLNWEP